MLDVDSTQLDFVYVDIDPIGEFMTKDEKAAQKATKEYAEAIDKHKLDDIENGWGQDRKRYMLDSFYCGFYAGRNYYIDKLYNLGYSIVGNKLVKDGECE